MSAGRFAKGIHVASPGVPTPLGVTLVRRVIGPFVRLAFGPTLEGAERLPVGRPYLLVANHSAGVGLAEILSFAVLWLDRFGTDRPIAGFALPVGFKVWPLSAAHRQVGTIPSTYEHAADALRRGVALLVFPGGDHESLKPVWQVHRVDFAGRVGFLRIASAAGVPVIPLGIRNGAFTAPIVWRSRILPWLLVFPRLIGVKRWGVSLLAVAGALAIATLTPLSPGVKAAAIWLWLGSPLTFLPIFPARLRLRVGEPIEPSELFAAGTDTAALAAAGRRVERAVEAEVRA